MLPAGTAFDLTERVLLGHTPRVTAEDAAELAEAQADLRRMARDIAADDVGPSQLRRRLARARTSRKTGPDAESAESDTEITPSRPRTTRRAEDDDEGDPR